MELYVTCPTSYPFSSQNIPDINPSRLNHTRTCMCGQHELQKNNVNFQRAMTITNLMI